MMNSIIPGNPTVPIGSTKKVLSETRSFNGTVRKMQIVPMGFLPDGFNPFLQPHYMLLNLAIGGNGGDPAKSSFPIKYEVDYVRVYQDK
jgi:hypothetical protein